MLKKDRQIPGLDLVRFAAALLVAGHHFGFLIWASGRFPANIRYLGPYTWAGCIGVEIFFVLSGFIIAYSAEHATAATFAKSRFLRLYPAAFLCSTLTLIALYLLHSPDLAHPILQRWIHSALLSPLPPYIDASYWTLSVELSFYALILLLLLFKGFRFIGLLMGTLGAVSSACWCVVFATRIGWLSVDSLTGHLSSFMLDNTMSVHLLLRHGCFFAIGTLLWLSLFHGWTLTRASILLICALGALAEIQIHCSYFLSTEITYSQATPQILWLAFVVAMVLSVHLNLKLKSILGAGGAATTRQLGLVTYPFYLIHQFIGYALIIRFHRYMPDILAVLITPLLLLACSFAIIRFGEAPLQRWLRNLLHFSEKKFPVPSATAP